MDSAHSRPDLKRKADDYHLGSKGWDLMRRMGWVEGEGLGTLGQGRTQPVQAKVPKKRQGLGAAESASSSLGFRVLEVSEVPTGPHAWSEDADMPAASIDDDRIYRWSRWPDDAKDLPLLALEALKTAILTPDSPQALGPPIEVMENQTLYCAEELLFEMLFYKNSLDKRGRDAITSGRIRSNPYENVRSGIFMNRAAIKMANMDSILNGIFSQAAPPHEILHFADICAGPGGFSEYLTWRRGHPLNSTSPTPHFPRIRGYGMTLAGPCDFKIEKFVAGPVETFQPFYGPAKDGDITKWENLTAFAQFIAHNTSGQGVHVVMADGGFDVSDSYNLQEVKSKHIYLCQFLCALITLRPGGCFIAKLFDVFTEFSVDLIWLMSHVFKSIAFIKPVSSRPANSERYLLCEGFISFNSGMAGCPKPPASATGSCNNFTTPQRPKSSFKQSVSAKRVNSVRRGGFGNGADCGSGDYQVDSTSSVGLLIRHFLSVGEQLHRRYEAERRKDEPVPLDILRLSLSDKKSDQFDGFTKFMTHANEEILALQCFYLSKMIVFADNGAKQDDSQDDLKAALLEKWQLPAIARENCAYPFWSGNIHPVLKNIISDPIRGPTFSGLPKSLSRPTDMCPLTEEDLPGCPLDSFYAVVLSELLQSPGNLPKSPVMVMSMGGGYSQGKGNLKYNSGGKLWNEFSWTESIHPRLPAGSLVWALVINIYTSSGTRKHVLMLLDAAFIYGIDLQSLSYVERMQRISELCDTLNFPKEDSVKIIPAPSMPLQKLHDFMQQLVPRSCKDTSEKLPMFTDPRDGCAWAPKSLLLVSPWSSQGKHGNGMLDPNDRINESVGPHFSETQFFQIPWTSGNDVDIDAYRLVEKLNSAQR